MKLPDEIRAQFQEAGRRGGKARVPKGFSKMEPDRRKQVAQKGGKVKKSAGLKRKPGKTPVLTPRPDRKDKKRGTTARTPKRLEISPVKNGTGPDSGGETPPVH